MTLQELNSLSKSAATSELLRCCGSGAWVSAMLAARPFESSDKLLEAADAVWRKLTESDWKEAFTHHARIGDVNSLRQKFASTAAWAGNEQAGIQSSPEPVLQRLAAGNASYEKRFGYIFIVCATEKSAEEMLALLESRLPNDPNTELLIAAEEQRKITRLRLAKLLR